MQEKSVQDNDVWNLDDLSDNFKPISYKWVLKIKRDSRGNIKVGAKGFTQRERFDFNDTFSMISIKDSFRITMALLVCFTLEIHQIDVMTNFLNGQLLEEIYVSARRF